VKNKKINIELDNNITVISPTVSKIEKWLTRYFDDEKIIPMGLGVSEMIFNSIEHGNLEISYAEKTKYLDKDIYFSELEKRAALPKFKNRKVKITCVHEGDTVKIILKDDGDGFNWKLIPSMQDNLYESHGRGINITQYCFDNVYFNEKGNEVTLVKKIDTSNA